MEENFKRIDLNDPNTFDSLSVNDRIVYEDEDRKEEVKALILKKKKDFFEAAYRAKDTCNGNMIIVDSYYLFNGLNGHKIYNFGPDRNYSENSMRDKANYFMFDIKLKKAGIKNE